MILLPCYKIDIDLVVLINVQLHIICVSVLTVMISSNYDSSTVSSVGFIGKGGLLIYVSKVAYIYDFCFFWE